MRVAVLQLCSTPDPAANRAAADRLVREAHARGARTVLLPEKWSALGRASDVAAGAEDPYGPSVRWARELARELAIDLFAGSVTVRRPDGRLQNTALHVTPGGRIVRYGKLHLFDADVAGTRYRESDDEVAGDGLVTTTLADDAATCVGMSVCYDLRFPELYRALAARGARILVVPAAFTARTTEAHWETLLRARAIENGAVVLAANQHGEHAPGIRSGGRSMIVDAWGTVLARAPETDEAVVVADLDLAHQATIREQLPVLRQRRASVAAALAALPDGDLAAGWEQRAALEGPSDDEGEG
ncbi:MAG: carbon-nitrogen hydrolase family protein [Patulibacter sp.]